MIFGNGSTGGVIGMGLAVSLYDNVSAAADTITRKFQTLEGVTDAAAAKITASMGKIQSGLGMLAVGGALIASLSFPISQAIEFESAFTGVRKTVNATNEEFLQLEKNFRDISKSAPISAVELSGIGEAAGQLGVTGVDNITKFTDTVAKLGVTTNLTTDAAATQFARISNIMQEPIDNIDRMGSTVVSLGNNFATTEAEITGFANRLAGAGAIAGLTTADIFGISTAFSSVGVEAERGGTAVSKTLFKMTQAAENGGEALQQFADVAGISAGDFKTLFEQDAAGAFNKFVAGLGTNGIKAVGLLEELELSDERLKQAFISVAGAGGIMEKAIQNAGKAWSENTALTNEAELRYNTVASQLQIMKNNFVDAAITIGQFFLPAVKVMSAILKGVAGVLGAIASTVIGKAVLSLVAGVALLTTVLGLYSIGAGAAGFASAKIALSFAAMGKTAIAAAFANGGLTAGMYALATAVWTALAPLLPFLAIGSAIIGVVMLLKKSVSMFSEVVSGAADPLDGFMGKMQKVGGVIMGALEIWRSATAETFTLSGDTYAALERLGIAELVVNMGTWIARIKNFFVGMGDTFSLVWDSIKTVTNAIFTALNKVGNAFGFDISKSTSNINAWATAGKIVAGVIMALIVPSLVRMAISVIAATWPIILIGGAIIGIIAIIKNWGSIVDWISAKFTLAMDYLKQKGEDLKGWFMGLPAAFMSIGQNIVTSIISGIKSGWSSLVNTMLDLLASLPGGGAILKFLGIEANVDGASGGGVVPVTPSLGLDTPTEIGRTTADIKTSTNRTEMTNTTSKESKEVLKTINLHIDGKEVKSIMDDQDKLEDSRHD